MDMIRLAAELVILLGAVNTGVLTHGHKALLFDCDDTVTYDRLAAIGVTQVEHILCTQHRRVNVAGAYPIVDRGAQMHVPAGERHLFDNTGAYWRDPKNRWYVYHFQPGPQVLARPIAVTHSVQDGDVIQWEGFRIRVLDTPGATEGAVSYLVEINGRTYCFSGDAVYAPGQVWDLYSLQKGYETRDYHGFLGNLRKLQPSLEKLRQSGASVLIPSHGEIMQEPEQAIQLTLDRLASVWANYTSISSLWHYHADVFETQGGAADRAVTAQVHPDIPFLRRIPRTTSSILHSESGAALMIDCGNDRAVAALRDMLKSQQITSVEGIWVTHYHNDHVDGIRSLLRSFDIPVITYEGMAEILEYPDRFMLPCLSPNSVPVEKPMRDGEQWKWREFTLTAYHFPGQTLYHSGLLIEGHGKRIFLGGDSFSPAGVDDYCAANRNYLGAGQGFDYCLRLLQSLQPDAVMNPHQDQGVTFSNDEIESMRTTLAEREQLLIKLLPHEHPNFGTDPLWVRTYPYEGDVFRGGTCDIAVQFTNHGDAPARAIVEPVLEEGWTWKVREPVLLSISPHRDGAIHVTVSVPDTAAPGPHVIPFRITWNHRYLGQMRHAVVHVMK